MSKILCVFYSRSGATRATMEKIAELLDAELVEITDGKKRKGVIGFFASGFDAMKKTPEELQSVHTQKPLSAYEHVILGTPVWAGRCSSVMRSFLIEKGAMLPENVSYVITHTGDQEYTEVYAQMDQYIPQPHVRGLSLQPKAENYHQKVYDFVRTLTGETTEAEKEN